MKSHSGHQPSRLTRVRIVALAVAFLVANWATPAFSQATCGEAQAQLQNYAMQVNTAANTAYYQIQMQCPMNPYYCQQQMYQLQAWYMQQANAVNNWYAQISQQCTSRGSGGPRPGKPSSSDDEPPALDEDAISDLQVDDEDKSVRIRIPSNPRGYRR